MPEMGTRALNLRISHTKSAVQRILCKCLHAEQK